MTASRLVLCAGATTSSLCTDESNRHRHSRGSPAIVLDDRDMGFFSVDIQRERGQPSSQRAPGRTGEDRGGAEAALGLELSVLFVCVSCCPCDRMTKLHSLVLGQAETQLARTPRRDIGISSAARVLTRQRQVYHPHDRITIRPQRGPTRTDKIGIS